MSQAIHRAGACRVTRVGHNRLLSTRRSGLANKRDTRKSSDNWYPFGAKTLLERVGFISSALSSRATRPDLSEQVHTLEPAETRAARGGDWALNAGELAGDGVGISSSAANQNSIPSQ